MEDLNRAIFSFFSSDRDAVFRLSTAMVSNGSVLYLNSCKKNKKQKKILKAFSSAWLLRLCNTLAALPDYVADFNES